MDIVLLIIVILAITGLAFPITAFTEGANLIGWITLGICFFFIITGLSVNYHRYQILANINEYTVIKNEMVNVKDGIYRIVTIKDPGMFLTNDEFQCYSLKPFQYGTKLKEGDC